ncbi:AAA family ATPase [Nitrosovibrio tenuis]|uniref:Flagellar biosynthesis protein FlhG n=1 Tax=Nitrosovibrio tenuis TaxID=1233 RepID=A0A1H7J7S4_9PROT|nr:AAA family ATPase [Nitrosovibrio tenuis]SEK70791.1 flagellar biosynthesis protein FlhG [Nitrosovibrio tenuis]
MTDPIHDQAEGLRRLLVQDFVRIVTITSGNAGTGKTTTVINLAAFLTRNGKNVLVIDENVGANNLSATLGISAHRDLLDVIRRDKTLDQVIISRGEGLHILPAGRGMRVLDKLSAGDRAHLIGCFARLAQPMDVVLIDAAPRRSSRLLPLNFTGHELLIVVSPEPNSITSAYALIKHINSQHQGKQRFHILVNKTGIKAEAQIIFDNMASAAMQYLDVSLDFMGAIPSDDKLCLGRAVAEAFPVAASAAAFRCAAESLTNWPCQEGESPRLERFIQCLLQSNQGNQSSRASAMTAGSW